MPPANTQKFIVPPVHFVEVPDGVILKRGSTEFKITGLQASSVVKTVLSAVGEDGASVDDICRMFSRSSAPRVQELIRELCARRLLLPGDHKHSSTRVESSLDVFYWQFGETQERAIAQFERFQLHIVGVNAISRQLSSSLRAGGWSTFTVIDHPQHRNPAFFDQNNTLNDQQWPNSLNAPQQWSEGQIHEWRGCVVVTSDSGGQEALRRWNRLCLSNSLNFMPIMLKNMVGYVGPYVMPKETACYECLIARRYSHANDFALELSADQAAFEKQRAIGFHPTMATMLGDIGAFELTRWHIEPLPGRKSGKLLEVDLLASRMMERTVLKVPRCPACSPLHRHARTNLAKTVFSK
jgi:molybdopterin-synthase adenylyltransferase